MYIVIVRHGETDLNKSKIVQGAEVDPPLNNLGKLQAKETAKFINKYVQFDKIYSSPLLRAKETAEIISQTINYKQKIIINDLLIESKKGIYSGKNQDQKNKLIQSDNFLKKWYKSIRKLDHFARYLFKQKNNQKYAKLTNKESFYDLEIRSNKIFNEIIKKNDKNILIVSHGSCIENLIKNIFNIEVIPNNIIHGKSSNCNVTIIESKNDKFKLIISMNNRHLQKLYN